MLDVFVGIGFTSVVILLVVFRAMRLDMKQAWFLPFQKPDPNKMGAPAPWRRNR